MATKVKIEMDFTDEEVWETVFGSSPEMFGTNWWVSYDFLEGSDWDKAGAVRITLLDPEDLEETGEKTVTKVLYPSDLVEALQKVVASGNRYTNWLDLEAYDSVAGDVIIQTAVYGEIVFG